MAQKGQIAAGHPETAKAGLALLEAGGNAFDAVLAAMCAATVAEPVLASLGGGGFLLARPPEAKPRLYDFFVQTPKRRKSLGEVDFGPIVADFGDATQEFHIGRGAMATPGLVSGLFRAHKDLGRAPITDVMAPAIALAKEGVTVNAFQAYIFSIVQAIYLSTPEARVQYASSSVLEDNTLLKEGDLFTCSEAAQAMDALAHEGADLFYRGEIGQALIAASEPEGGSLSMADLEGYETALREPLSLRYGPAQLFVNPPPSTGGALIAFALSLLQGQGFAKAGFGEPDHVWALVSAMVATSKARLETGLSDGGDVAQAARHLFDPALVARYRAEVVGRPEAHRGTTQISVIDGDGAAASLTLSNGEGCGFLVPGTGIMMNNMLGEEDINPGGFYTWAEDQRMTSMMCPSLLLHDEGWEAAIGSGGSNRIRSAILQTVLNSVDFGMELEEAVSAPRVHCERQVLSVEPGYDLDLLGKIGAELSLDVKPWRERNLFFGGVHAVSFDPKKQHFDGAGDPRRGGYSLGV